jgi:hypothetical protein
VESMSSTLTNIALTVRDGVEDDGGGDGEDVLGRMVDLVDAGQALDLRLARLLAWFKRQDLAPLGIPSYTSFCAERVDWKSTWIRQLVRLASSELEAVKMAVCTGAIPITTAVLAPSQTDVAGEADWLLAALEGLVAPTWVERDATPKCTIEGKDARTVHRARQLARLCLGRAVSDGVADRFVLHTWRQQRCGKEVLAEARETPPAPDLSPLPPWCQQADPATALLGPWVTPRDVNHGLELLELAKKARRRRIMELGQLYSLVGEDKLYRDWGYLSLAEMARDGLGLSARTLERYRLAADNAFIYPELGRAIATGLDLDRAEILQDIVEEETVERWLALARRTGVQELARAVRFAVETGVEPVLQAYEGAMAHTTETVALRAVQRLPTAPAYDLVHPDLVEAATWFFVEVKPERQYGFGKVKERANFTCENPECGRPTLRLHAHHLVQRSHGGGNEDANAVALCCSCHLRLIHSGHLAVERRGANLIWRYPGRTVVCFGAAG